MKHRIRRTIRAGLFGLGILLAVFAPPVSARPLRAQTEPMAKPDEDSWQVIYIGDQRVGYSQTSTQKINSQGKPLIRTVNESTMTLKRFGQELKMQTLLSTDETEQGDMVSFVLEIRNPPASTTRTVGRVDGKWLRLETTVAGRVREKRIAWDPQIKSPAFQDRLMRESLMKPGETRSFKTFAPEFNRVTTVKLTADDYRPTKLLGGKVRKLLKVRVIQSILPSLTMRTYLDEKGESLKTETGLMNMVIYTVSKEEALTAIAGAELDLAVNSLVRVKPIRDAHRTRKIVYRITTPGEDASKYLVPGDTQQVRKTGSDSAELTVTAIKPTDATKPVKVNPEYLQATRFLQCRDLRVIEHARKAGAGETNPGRIAFRMERYVHDKLEKKNFSTALASAAEVARTLAGDCTEHAVLLAAMLRTAKIPSRIAVGLVYIESSASFGGHMWTEAFLGGKWIPLDATLGHGGIGAAHIKMVESSFADDAPAPVTSFLPLLKVLGKIKIEVLETHAQ